MKINCVTFKSCWIDRVPGASNIIAKNPINNLSNMGKIEELVNNVDTVGLANLYNTLVGLGLPNNYNADYISGAEGLTLIGPSGIIPFRLVTSTQSVSAGSTVDGVLLGSYGEYADTNTITAAFNSIVPDFSSCAILMNNAIVGNIENTSSVSAQNEFQDTPSTTVKKGRNANAGFRLNITGNLLRNATSLCKRVGSSITVGGFVWDSAAADLELPLVNDASALSSVMTQWQIEVDDNLISSALSQTGRIYAVFGCTNLVFGNPSLTGSAAMAPMKYIPGARPTVCCAIDLTNSSTYAGSIELRNYSNVVIAAMDLTFVGGVQINNEIASPIFN